jgi:hypothetical protein
MNPRLLAVIAALGLTGGWGCFGSPAATPVQTTTPTPSPTIVPSDALAPRAGRVYHYDVGTKDANGTLTLSQQVIAVQSVSGDSATYDLTTNLIFTSPNPTQKGLKVTRTHGIFWIGSTPDPLTKDVSSYPVMTFMSGNPPVTGLGPFSGNVATIGDSTYYFADGVLIRAATPTLQISLQSIQ